MTTAPRPPAATLDRIAALQRDMLAIDSEITYRLVVGRPCSARPQFATMTAEGLESERRRMSQSIDKMLAPFERGAE